MMEFFLVAVSIILLIAIIYIITLLQRSKQSVNKDTDSIIINLLENMRKDINETGGKNRLELHDQLEKINKQILSHQQANNSSIQKQFQQSATIIQDVTNKLKEFEGTNKQILNFAEQLKSLENILQNPKQRGILGEYFLESLLANVLSPNQYKMQYKFSNGDIVDAVVFVKDNIIPIDAKFSLRAISHVLLSRSLGPITILIGIPFISYSENFQPGL